MEHIKIQQIHNNVEDAVEITKEEEEAWAEYQEWSREMHAHFPMIRINDDNQGGK